MQFALIGFCQRERLTARQNLLTIRATPMGDLNTVFIWESDTPKDQMIDIEKLSDKELERLAKRYEKVRQECLDRKERS
jgi:hypothetical protein